MRRAKRKSQLLRAVASPSHTMASLLARAAPVRLAAPAAAGRRASARQAAPVGARQARPLRLATRRLQPLRVIKESGAVKGRPENDDQGYPEAAGPWDTNWEENPADDGSPSCEIQSCQIEPFVEPVENYEPKDDVSRRISSF